MADIQEMQVVQGVERTVESRLDYSDINAEVVDPSRYPLTPNKKTQKSIRAGRREFADELGYAKIGKLNAPD